jgi:transporter family-2 protein
VLLIGGVVLVTGGGRFDPLATAAIFLVGLLVAFQPPVNARLADQLGGLRAALTQSSIGLAALILITGCSLPFASGGSGVDLPWWAFTGGLLGAFYVVSTLASVPAIGAGGVAAASIAGGLAFGAAADFLGMFGLETVDFTSSRAVGFALIASGAGLVLRRQS